MQKIKNEIGEDMFGFCYPGKKGYEIGVNIERLWEKAIKRAPIHPETSFIKRFMEVYIHESLHIAIRRNYRTHRKWELGEEITVFLLMNERMTRNFIDHYKELYQ